MYHYYDGMTFVFFVTKRKSIFAEGPVANQRPLFEFTEVQEFGLAFNLDFSGVLDPSLVPTTGTQ